MDFLQLAEARYSVRKFTPQKVEQEKIDKLLRAAQLAPTACNNQSWFIYVLQSDEALAAMDQCSPFRFGAPLAFLICYDISRQASVATNEVNLGLVDSAIATTQVILAAADLGLGSCWICRFDAEKTCEVFDLPDELEPACFVPIGYADMGPGPGHANTLPLDQLVKYL